MAVLLAVALQSITEATNDSDNAAINESFKKFQSAMTASQKTTSNVNDTSNTKIKNQKKRIKELEAACEKAKAANSGGGGGVSGSSR